MSEEVLKPIFTGISVDKHLITNRFRGSQIHASEIRNSPTPRILKFNERRHPGFSGDELDIRRHLAERPEMASPNYQGEKRRKDLAKQAKKKEKALRKLDKKSSTAAETSSDPVPET